MTLLVLSKDVYFQSICQKIKLPFLFWHMQALDHRRDSRLFATSFYVQASQQKWVSFHHFEIVHSKKRDLAGFTGIHITRV